MERATYPKVKLSASAAADARLGVNFLKYTRGKRAPEFFLRFFPDELHAALNKKTLARVRNKLIRAYALRTHWENQKEIARGVRRVEKEWARVKRKYFQLVDRIFNHCPWPKGAYKGFVTVFYMYPRNVPSKTFYFPYTHLLPWYANNVIAHELLHFMFFDYVRERYGLREHARLSGKPRDYLWQVSEAFNNAIEGWESYRKVFRYSPHPHPGTEALASRMTLQWAREQNIEKLLDRYLL